jgi:hypothetical protein
MKRAASLVMAPTGSGRSPASPAVPDRNVRPGVNRTWEAVTFGASAGAGHFDVRGTRVGVGDAVRAAAPGPDVQPDRPASNPDKASSATTGGKARRILALRQR